MPPASPEGSAQAPAAAVSVLHRNKFWATLFLIAFAIASLLATGAGCLVVRAAGAGAGGWIRNLGAWLAGALLAPILIRVHPETLFRAILLITPLALLFSFFSRGQSGVHRWIQSGPLNWNVAFLFVPAAIVAFAATARSGPRWIFWAAMVTQLELLAQPDASQATAFAAAVIAALWTNRVTTFHPLRATLLFSLAAFFTWFRPDQLAPVAEVEDILKLAWGQSLSMAGLCTTALFATVASPLIGWNSPGTDRRSAAIALCLYFLVCSVMRLFGAFPVPVVGVGMSPVIGFWIGAATLVCLQTSTSGDSK